MSFSVELTSYSMANSNRSLAANTVTSAMRRAFIFLLLLALPVAGACSNSKKVEWTEEVRLSDGRMLAVKRHEEYRQVTDAGAGFRTGWLFQRSSISAEIPAPINQKVVWHGTLKPLVLDFQSNALYLVCRVATGAGRREWNVLRGEAHVAFIWEKDDWKRISLSELPPAVQPNLLGNTYGLFIDRSARSGVHVDPKLKQELDSQPGTINTIRQIVRPSAPVTGK